MNEDQDMKIIEAICSVRKAEMEVDLALQDLRRTIAEALDKLEELRKI